MPPPRLDNLEVFASMVAPRQGAASRDTTSGVQQGISRRVPPGPPPSAVLRLALRLFTEGLHAHVFRDAVGNLVEAAAEARRVLG